MLRVAAAAGWATLAIGLAASDANAQIAPVPQSAPAVTLFPSTDPYGAYVADPDRPTNMISFSFYTHDAIPEARTPRAALAAGGRFGILRIVQAGGRSWQVNIDAGLDALFDTQNREDAIGWDGIYGLSLTTTSAGSLDFKVGMSHGSGHLGDEYQERTGAARINYTRQEISVGVSRRFQTAWRVYGETGIAYVNAGPGLKPFRLQLGAEYESHPTLFGDRFSWYGAGDFSIWQERGGRLDSAIQGGIVTRTEGRAYRFGMAFDDGRPPVTQFYRLSEACLTVGFWVDF